MIKKISLVTSLAMGLAWQAQAQEDENTLVVGLGVMSESDLYQDISSGASPVPIFIGNYGGVWFRGNTIGYEVFESEFVSISPILELNLGGGYETADVESGSRLYEGLEDRDNAFELGVEVEFEVGFVELQAGYRTDISDTHSADIAELSVSQEVMLFGDRVMLQPSIGVSWVGKDYNQYYYGVAEEDATEFRSAYDAKAGTNFEASVIGIWDMGPVNLMGRLAYDQYDSSILDSDLVKEDSQTSIAIGLGYAF